MALLTMTLTAISQLDIANKDSLICLPTPTFKKIILDLESGDFAKKELKISYEINTDLNKQISYKDGIILRYQQREATYKSDSIAYGKTLQAKDSQIELAVKEARKYRRQRNGVIVGGSALIIAIPTLILVFTL
jgi:hypothetical protein